MNPHIRYALLTALCLCLCGCASQVPTRDATGMDAYTKDVIDAAAKLAGFLTIAVGAIGLLHQIGKTRGEKREAEAAHASRARAQQEQREKELQAELRQQELRREELRWRKANLARDVLKEMLQDGQCKIAMRMVDWDGWKFDAGSNYFTISHVEMVHALRVDNITFKPAESFVRDAFEAFFDHMETTEHYLRSGLLEFTDVRYPYSYYVAQMRPFRPAMVKFLEAYRYEGAVTFLNRFSEWTAA